MAKKETLSLEELLEQALVKDEDKPYEVPKNWVWSKMSLLIELISGRDLPLNDCNDKKTGIPYIMGASNIEDGIFIVSRWTENPTVMGLHGDVLLSVKGTVGKIALLKESEIHLSRQIMALRSKRIISNIFLKHILGTYINYLIETSRGLIPGISREDILNIKIPLPPLSEQQRIVTLIESLFKKLDRAKELAQNALDSFENRKSAILHKAFTGELTQKWREMNGVDFKKNWEEKKFGDLGELERGKSKHRPRNAPELFGGEYPFIQTGDVANSNIYITEHKQTLSSFGLKQSRLFPEGTLCITIAANIGDVAILSYACCFPDSVVGFTPNDKTNSKFIFYYMNIIKDEIKHNAPATAQKNINLKILNEIVIKTPPLAEQQEIVRILDNLLENEQKAKDLCSVIDKIDYMKKSILARAFRGELGTNNPVEESALELLKEVLKEKVQ